MLSQRNHLVLMTYDHTMPLPPGTTLEDTDAPPPTPPQRSETSRASPPARSAWPRRPLVSMLVAMSDESPDEELLRRWQAGDKAAGKVLFARYWDAVTRFFRNKVSDPADLAQRTILSLLENADRFRGESTFRTFVFAIARHVLLKHFRERQGPRGKVDLGTVSVIDMGESPSQVMADAEQQQLLRLAMQRLPLDQQTLLELFYWERLKVSELAEVLEIPVGTVKTRMRAARKRLRELIEQLASTPQLRDETLSLVEEEP